jgi:hypothetical protein
MGSDALCDRVIIGLPTAVTAGVEATVLMVVATGVLDPVGIRVLDDLRTTFVLISNNGVSVDTTLLR